MYQRPQNIFHTNWERSGKYAPMCSVHFTHRFHSQIEPCMSLLFSQNFYVSRSHPWEPVEAFFVILNMACFGSLFHSFLETKQPAHVDLYHLSVKAFYCLNS